MVSNVENKSQFGGKCYVARKYGLLHDAAAEESGAILFIGYYWRFAVTT